MVIVDVNKRGDLPTDAYFAVEEIKDVGHFITEGRMLTMRHSADEPY
jgi:hypothetical protein